MVAGIIQQQIDGFTSDELYGNSFILTDLDYPTCFFDVTFNDDNTFVNPDGDTIDYVLENGSIIFSGEDGQTRTISVQSRNSSSVIINFVFTGSIFKDDTAQWSIDFTQMHNDAITLKDWFITNGFWSTTTLLPDGRVIRNGATIEGEWWIDNNVLYFAHPEIEPAGCVDYKAYKLENDRLMFATDADHSSVYEMVAY